VEFTLTEPVLWIVVTYMEISNISKSSQHLLLAN